MATETPDVPLTRAQPENIESTIGRIKKMVVVGAVFAVVGYLLVGSALFLELTQFHPAIETLVSEHTAHSLAGGGPDRAGMAALNSQLITVHQWPSLLLWLKLGGIAHVLFGIFIVLAAIVQALSVMPHRLSYEMERTRD